MRSSLEKASWIAGIISAVIAIFAVLPPQKVENVEPSLATENKVAVITSPSMNPNNVPSTEKSVMTMADIRIPPPCETNSNLQEAIRTAQTIYSTTERDAAYASLVHDALCSNETNLALSTASKIYTTTSRDECLYKCVEYYVFNSKPQTATPFAEKIHTTSLRDKAKQVIIVGMKASKPTSE